MNKLFKISMPVVITFSFMLLINTVGGSNIYGQILDNITQSNPISSAINQTKQQLGEQREQTLQQVNQTKQQLGEQSKNITAISDKLLNFTNSAITALDSQDTETVKQNLMD